MSSYQAPLRDMQFVLRELAEIDEVAKLPGFEDTSDVLDSILEEAGTFASEVLDPLNVPGDKGCVWHDGEVTTPKGFKEAYHQFAKAGWIGLPVPEEFGGQGLPQLLLGPTLEMWNGSNVGFANGPLLTRARSKRSSCAVRRTKRAVHSQARLAASGPARCASPNRKPAPIWPRCARRPCPKAITTDQRQKIFITFGEHDMAPNIIHLVLARLPDAPEGTKGISMFIVPKVLVNPDGSLGERNDVYCA